MILKGMVGPVRQHNIMSSSLSVCGIKGTSWNKKHAQRFHNYNLNQQNTY